MTLTLNPGFVPIIAALLVLALPRAFRPPVMAGAGLVALWLLLDHEFGAAAAMAQMGLPVVLLNLDALNRIFGVALLLALTAIAIYSSGRRNRYEDAAILLLAGGAVSALFVGDLVSFVAATSLAGLTGAWCVFASPLTGAERSGVRVLIWHGIEGLLFLIGVALLLSAGREASVFARLEVTSWGGGFLFAALMVRIGAPLAHVWLKDAVSHASPAGAAALTVFSPMLGVYALARFFPAEPLLVEIGAAMILLGAAFAVAEDDLRRGAMYALMTQIGACVALIGLGSPLAHAAAQGHVFSTIFVYLGAVMCLGAVIERRGEARVSALTGLSARMPVTAGLWTLAVLALAAMPGFASYATQSVVLEAAAQADLQWLWLLFAAAPAVIFAGLGLRPLLAMFRPSETQGGRDEAPFSFLLGAVLVVFFCFAVGVAPRWLYGLMPTELTFAPFALDRVARQFETLGAAGLVFVLLEAAGATLRERNVRLLDADAFYRGPMAAAGRWSGSVLSRIYAAWGAGAGAASRAGARALQAIVQRGDRPYQQPLAAAAQLLAVGVLAAIAMLLR